MYLKPSMTASLLFITTKPTAEQTLLTIDSGPRELNILNKSTLYELTLTEKRNIFIQGGMK